MLRLMPTRKNTELIKSEDIFDRFFDEFFSPLESMHSNFNSFKVDVREDDEGYMIEADLPGFNKQDLSITYENNYLTISAKKDEIVEEKKAQFIRRERQFGEFRRTFYIENIDIEQVNAKFDNGILEIKINKVHSPSPRKNIEIK